MNVKMDPYIKHEKEYKGRTISSTIASASGFLKHVVGFA